MKEIFKILFSKFRKVDANFSQKALDSIVVQPMSPPTGKIYKMSPPFSIDEDEVDIVTGIDKVNIAGTEVKYYFVKLPNNWHKHNNASLVDVREWCVQTFGENVDGIRWYQPSLIRYYFKSEDDRNWFLLKWG